MRYGFLRRSGGGVLLKLLIAVKLPRLGPMPSLKNAATCFNIPKLFPAEQVLAGSLAKRPALLPRNPPAPVADCGHVPLPCAKSNAVAGKKPWVARGRKKIRNFAV